jgi:hypothetical protein
MHPMRVAIYHAVWGALPQARTRGLEGEDQRDVMACWERPVGVSASMACPLSANRPTLSPPTQGMAFSDNERDRLYLRGLLPPAILSQVRARACMRVRVAVSLLLQLVTHQTAPNRISAPHRENPQELKLEGILHNLKRGL